MFMIGPIRSGYRWVTPSSVRGWATTSVPPFRSRPTATRLASAAPVTSEPERTAGAAAATLVSINSPTAHGSKWETISTGKLVPASDTLSLSRDGTRVIAGGINAGARVFTRDADGDVWELAGSPVHAVDSRGGIAVALSGDGLVSAVGATYFRGIAGNWSGLVRLYDLP